LDITPDLDAKNRNFFDSSLKSGKKYLKNRKKIVQIEILFNFAV